MAFALRAGTSFRPVTTHRSPPYRLELLEHVASSKDKAVFSCLLRPEAPQAAAIAPVAPVEPARPRRAESTAGAAEAPGERLERCALKVFMKPGDGEAMEERAACHPLFLHLDDRSIVGRMSNPRLSLVDYGLMPHPLEPGAPPVPFVLVPWVEGIPLSKLEQQLRLCSLPLDLRHVIDLLISLACCISDLQHVYPSCYVVHQDVKPSNIIVVPVSSALPDTAPGAASGIGLADLVRRCATPATSRAAVASCLIDLDSSFSSLPGSVPAPGTLGYTAPENLLDPAVVPNPRMDVFSLGVVAHELATGGWPYAMPTALQTDRAAWRELYASAGSLPVSVRIPQPLAALIGACLAIDPTRRPTIDEVIDELGRVRQAFGRQPISVVLSGTAGPVATRS